MKAIEFGGSEGRVTGVLGEHACDGFAEGGAGYMEEGGAGRWMDVVQGASSREFRSRVSVSLLR